MLYIPLLHQVDSSSLLSHSSAFQLKSLLEHLQILLIFNLFAYPSLYSQELNHHSHITKAIITRYRRHFLIVNIHKISQPITFTTIPGSRYTLRCEGMCLKTKSNRQPLQTATQSKLQPKCGASSSAFLPCLQAASHLPQEALGHRPAICLSNEGQAQNHLTYCHTLSQVAQCPLILSGVCLVLLQIETVFYMHVCNENLPKLLMLTR